MIKQLIILTFLFTAATSCTKKTPIPGNQWSASFKQDQTIGLDVRTTEEVSSEPSTHGLNIPVSELKEKALKKLPNKDAQIFVFCRSGGRAGQAVPILKELGYTNVTNVKTWKNWNALQKE